jgi:hypothetical protein
LFHNEADVKKILAVLVVSSAVAAAGCSSSTDTSSTLPAAPSSPLVTNTFSGTVPVGGNDSNPFTVTSDGFQITIDLTAAGPPPTITMGIGIGAPVGGTCQLLSGGSTMAQAGATPQLSGNIPAGQYCLMIYDVGNQAGPITYTVVVNHY